MVNSANFPTTKDSGIFEIISNPFLDSRTKFPANAAVIGDPHKRGIVTAAFAGGW